jgi:phytoene synthase
LSDIVRRGDPDRYIADLFAPAEARAHLFALHAFAVEVASIRGRVSEPALGEVRLKWWEGALRGDHGGSPVAAALAEAITRFRLPLVAFDNLLQARIFDLYDDPMPTVNDLEGYAGDTEAALMQLGAMVLVGGQDPGTAELAGFAGVAVALPRLLRALPESAAFLPADLLARHGASVGGVGEGSARRRVVADLCALARERLGAARRAAESADPALLPAFLPAAMVETYLRRLEQEGGDPLTPVADVSPLRRQWVLWRAARRGRF